jgi:hypothetical protein
MCEGYGWIASDAMRICGKITTEQEKLHFSRIVTEKLRQFSYLNFSIQILRLVSAFALTGRNEHATKSR